FPCVDGLDLPDFPQKLVDAGSVPPVPIILGTNQNEGTLFVGPNLPDASAYAALMDAYFPGQGAAIVSRYPGRAFGSLTSAAAEALGDAQFVCPTRRVARAFAKRGANAFLYRFAHVPTSGPVQGKGVYHTAEVPFVFGNPSLGVVLDASEQRLSKAMQGYWAALAMAGSPGTEDMVSWPMYDLASEADLVLDLQLSTETSLKKEACDFWDTITP